MSHVLKNMQAQENSSKCLAEGRFIEKWKDLAYTYGGVFVVDGEGLTQERIDLDQAECMRKILSNRKIRVPRFFSRFVLVIAYCASSFGEEATAYLLKKRNKIASHRRLYTVLFNTKKRKFVHIQAMQNDTILFYFDILDHLNREAISIIQEREKKRSNAQDKLDRQG